MGRKRAPAPFAVRTRGTDGTGMSWDALGGIAFFVVWILLQTVILPRLGVPT